MFKNTYFGRRGSAAIALKYARMNQKDKKEEKKPVTVAKDDKDIIEALKTHMEMAEAIEAGLAQPQQTVETQHHDMQEDIDIADSIPRMEDTETSNGFGFLDDMDITHHSEQAGFDQAQPNPQTESALAKKCEKIQLSEEEEERVEAMFLRDRYDPELKEAQYKIKTTREHLINRIPENETRAELKISHQEYINLVASVRLLDGVMYKIPEKARKVRKLTIGDNGAIISSSNMKALGVYDMYPKDSEAIPVIDSITGWLMLKPCNA